MIKSLTVLILSSILMACGGGSSNNTNNTPSLTASQKYSTTSTKGDYTEWTITGNQLVANWQVISSTGQTRFTINIEATCGAAATSGIQDCTFNTVTCDDGVEVCPVASALPTGSFSIMNVPDVALFAYDSSDQLHVGFAKNDDACTEDVSGDYTYMHLGLGKRDIFGLYRSDNNFINIVHSDFGFTTTDSNATQALNYNTGTASETLQDDGCIDGVRSRTIVGLGQIRSMMTASGLFVLDLPAGEGGILAFKANNAATLADFANKSFGGLSFPDDANPEPLNVNFGAVSANKIDFSGVVGSTAVDQSIMALSTADTLTTPAYPDFTIAPAGYNTNPLQSDYATTNDIPGLFKIDKLSDAGRVILAGLRFNDKVVAFGAVYNYRDTSDTDPSTGMPFTSDGLYNTGSFLIFEK